MSEIHDKVSKNILNNMHNINLALENTKIESKVLTPAFTEKLEKLRNIVTSEDKTNNNSTSNFSPSFNHSDSSRQYSRQEINAAFARIKALPKEFAPITEKKPVTKNNSSGSSIHRSNVTRAVSLQCFNENSRPTSRSNSLVDLVGELPPPKTAVKVEELLEKIDQNKGMLEGITACALKYPKTTNFGEERFKLASEFRKALAEITEMVDNLEQFVKGIDSEDIDLGLDAELNELLEQFTKTIKDYNFIQQHSTIELDTNLNDHELEFPYSPILAELKAFLDKY